MHMMGGGGPGGFWWMPVMMGVYVLILIILAVVLIRSFTKGSGKGKSAIDILNEQLARGEISEEDYDRLKAKILDSERRDRQ
ncbi:SHOCT domain-containing protein [Salisediminibacterium selenitireducens]|uniref:SHOCT domain-containing protein n=1 Tax=Bacillus selenitireducens (strain ATCC 700615 / DSM 15326 / MLS10) TaxID=439292 RepID=D6XWL4_BACIE|nr:SHOCT domain-containing protein [Salisediminibacterium selenitireducens]ADH97856.1 Protein of unknown function DUF2078, membrane [[Bacillus] selenitireducens MLS10]